MNIIRTNPITGEKVTLDLPVTEEQLMNWHKGALIQDVMPHLTPNQREFLMTGIIPEQWEKMYYEWL